MGLNRIMKGLIITMSTHELALLAIVHDEEGQLYHNINEVLPFIEKYYPQAYIAVSEVTSHKVKKLLELEIFILLH